jgi:uncharacterized protein
MKIISSKFKPAWWCRHHHLQTLYPTLFRKQAKLKLSKEQFELPDSDFIDLSWTQEKKAGPIIILLHGLEGSIDSPYAKGILKMIQDKGWQGVLMHFRGCGGQHNRLDRGYHSGETGDLGIFVKSLKIRYPDRKLAAIGISLGGNVLLKYLGEQGEQCTLISAMAVSVPFDLADSARKLNRGFSKIYQQHLINRLSKKIRNKFKERPAPFDIDKLDKWLDFHSFDHNVTAPIHGFKSGDDYYAKSSCKQFIKNITTPTLILHSKDDPFMSSEAIPTEDEISSNVTLELTEHGGHVGFIYGKSPFNTQYWVEKRMADFFNDKLNC